MWVRAQDGSLVNLDQAFAVVMVPERGSSTSNGGGPLELRAFGAGGSNAVLARGTQGEARAERARGGGIGVSAVPDITTGDVLAQALERREISLRWDVDRDPPETPEDCFECCGRGFVVVRGTRTWVDDDRTTELCLRVLRAREGRRGVSVQASRTR